MARKKGAWGVTIEREGRFYTGRGDTLEEAQAAAEAAAKAAGDSR